LASSRSCRPTPTLYPWTYDRSLYRRRNEIERLFRRRNEIERLFRRPKGFRRIFSRFEKLDTMFIAFIHFTLIIDMTCVNML
jgi:transposase